MIFSRFFKHTHTARHARTSHSSDHRRIHPRLRLLSRRHSRLVHISLMDTSVRPYGGNARDAELRSLDGKGTLLADAKSDHKFGVVRLIHPEAGDCAAAEQSASASAKAQDQWRQCFETLSVWLVTWAGESDPPRSSLRIAILRPYRSLYTKAARTGGSGGFHCRTSAVSRLAILACR